MLPLSQDCCAGSEKNISVELILLRKTLVFYWLYTQTDVDQPVEKRKRNVVFLIIEEFSANRLELYSN